MGVLCPPSLLARPVVEGDALGALAGLLGMLACVAVYALILSAVDISGRSMLRYTASIPTEKVGTFDTELAEEFWTAFARCAGITLHIRQLDGINSHHIVEGMFKAMARALKTAVKITGDALPSTKGVL